MVDLGEISANIVRDRVLEATPRLRMGSDPSSCTTAEGVIDEYGRTELG